jgi:hypothetical protein
MSIQPGVDTEAITSSTCIGSAAPAADVIAPSLIRSDGFFFYVPGTASLDHMVFYGYQWIALEKPFPTVYDLYILISLFDEYRPTLY